MNSLAALSVTMSAATGCGPASDIETAIARRGDLVIGVDVQGQLEAVDSSKLRPPGLPGVWNFKLSFLAPEGTVVKKGDRLAAFDAAEQMRELETQSNAAESAATEIRRATSSAKMARENERLGLAERGAAVTKLGLKTNQPADLVSSIELETTRLDHRVATIAANHERARGELAERSDAASLAGLRDKLNYAKGRVAEIQSNIARFTVLADREGTVIHPSGRRGEKVKVGDSIWRMQMFVEVVSLEEMRGSGTVDEVDSLRVKPGRKFSLRVDAHPDSELTGVVAEVGDSFVAKSQADPSKVVKVELTIEDDKSLPLRPGMRFRGEIEVERVSDVVVVPIGALFVHEGASVVYRAVGSGFEQVRVEVGARSATEIQVISGLSESDRVALTIPGAP